MDNVSGMTGFINTTTGGLSWAGSTVNGFGTLPTIPPPVEVLRLQPDWVDELRKPYVPEKESKARAPQFPLEAKARAPQFPLEAKRKINLED